MHTILLSEKYSQYSHLDQLGNLGNFNCNLGGNACQWQFRRQTKKLERIFIFSPINHISLIRVEAVIYEFLRVKSNVPKPSGWNHIVAFDLQNENHEIHIAFV